MVLTKIPHGGGQNGHLGLVLMAAQYAIVSLDPFVCPNDPSQTPTILDWEAPLNKEKSSGNTMNTVVNTKSVGMWMPYSAISY